MVEAPEPIINLVTKFGGQPVWLDAPQWPISRATGQPMTFICQIVLTPDLFGMVFARMAYVFMTDVDDIVETWDPDEGENAIILQPGPPSVPTQPLLTGPSIYRMAAQPD